MINILSKLLTFGAACDPGGSFLGFKTWYAYLEGETDALGNCIPQAITRTSDGTIVFGDIWLIALALVDTIIRIAALVAIGFVIYGGIEMITSNGNPEQINKARNTIINAVVGLVIAIAAAGIISFLTITLR